MSAVPQVNVGAELLDVPFPQMVEKLALAIAVGQLAMDLESIKITSILANTDLPADTVPMVIDESQSPPKITYYPSEPLLVYGINPTWYQFTEAVIQVKMAITMVETTKTSSSLDEKFSVSNTNTFTAGGGGGILSLFGGPSISDTNKLTVAYASTYDAKYSNKYQFKEQGTSQLSITLNPVPPPKRLTPTFIPPPPATGTKG
jgi:hypothetical protein